MPRRPNGKVQPLFRMALLAFIAIASGCYPYRGQPRNDSPAELIAEANAACQRYDRRAYETLLERLVREHPDAPERGEARAMLDDELACRPKRDVPDSAQESPDVPPEPTSIEPTNVDAGFQSDENFLRGAE